MTRLFGTDGIRGVANVDLRPSLAFELGRATAHQVVGPGGALVVGHDTRRSGDMFVAAITAGATSMGADVHQVGIVPTPALAFLAADPDFAAGIMVSASHNPAEDNGLKVLDPSRPQARRRRRGRPRGRRAARRRAAGRRRPTRSGGRSRLSGLLARYVAHRRELADVGRRRRPPRRAGHRQWGGLPRRARDPARDRRPGDGDPRRARTATTSTATAGRPPRPRSPTRSEHPARDVGFALDGDADRCVAVDGEGQARRRRPGARHPRARSPRARRARPAAASSSRCCPTAGSRPWSRRPAAGSSGRPSATSTSSRRCWSRAPGLGGEKSGHVIVREHSTSGDGIVTALELLRVMTAARAGPRCARAPRSRSCRSSSARSASGTATSGRTDVVLRAAIADAERAAGAARPGPRSVPRAPNPCCGSWSRAATRRPCRSWPTRSRRSQATVYTRPSRRGRGPASPRRTPQAHVRHRRLHRPA